MMTNQNPDSALDAAVERVMRECYGQDGSIYFVVSVAGIGARPDPPAAIAHALCAQWSMTYVPWPVAETPLVKERDRTKLTYAIRQELEARYEAGRRDGYLAALIAARDVEEPYTIHDLIRGADPRLVEEATRRARAALATPTEKP